MPTFADAVQFFGGQFFGATTLPADIDLTGKTILITGGNTGLGLECAKQLVNLNVTRLILACRDTKKGETAKEEILAASESATNQAVQIDIWELDLSQYSSVKNFGERFQKDPPRLDGFIANAGVEIKDFQTAEGLEMSLTVNVISTFMTGLFALPVLRETTKTRNVTTNLVFVGSLIHAFGPDQQLDAVPKDKGYLRIPKQSHNSRHGKTATLSQN